MDIRTQFRNDGRLFIDLHTQTLIMQIIFCEFH